MWPRSGFLARPCVFFEVAFDEGNTVELASRRNGDRQPAVRARSLTPRCPDTAFTSKKGQAINRRLIFRWIRHLNKQAVPTKASYSPPGVTRRSSLLLMSN